MKSPFNENSGGSRRAYNLGNAARNFFGAVPGSLKNHLNSEELVRITVAALAAGGGIMGLLQSVLAGVGTIFPAPTDAALAALILTVILESLRRLGHGREPAPDAARGIGVPQGSRSPWYRI